MLQLCYFGRCFRSRNNLPMRVPSISPYAFKRETRGEMENPKRRLGGPCSVQPQPQPQAQTSTPVNSKVHSGSCSPRRTSGSTRPIAPSRRTAAVPTLGDVAASARYADPQARTNTAPELWDSDVTPRAVNVRIRMQNSRMDSVRCCYARMCTIHRKPLCHIRASATSGHYTKGPGPSM